MAFTSPSYKKKKMSVDGAAFAIRGFMLDVSLIKNRRTDYK